MKASFLTVRTVLVLALVLGPVAARAGGEFKHRGVVLPGGSVKVGEDRFRMPWNWDQTHKFLKTTYPYDRFPRKFVVNQPSVKAVHIVNKNTKDEWEGLNVYEIQTETGREVRLYILARPPEPQPATEEQPVSEATPQ
jgi:hypothetical protein